MVVLDTDHLTPVPKEGSPREVKSSKLSNNLSDFGKVPGLKVADWTLPGPET